MIRLEKNNIKLRALEPEDLDFLFQTENDTSLWEVSNTQVPFSKFILKQYLTNSHQDIYEAKQLRLIIEQDNQAIGMIDLFDFEPQHYRAGIGIVILKPFQNKHFANTALQLFINYAFNTLNLHQLYANITMDNKNSIKLFTNNNFTFIGIKKDWIYINSQYKDEGLYQLINNK
ncbi:MAG TPA: GNAT family N-acetyltransferase [Flavobacteriaceae bacterium]|nr:GNAT family N-acetyltransferase [Flavobacteriaceae bacterium]